ncbi:hypothetical protein GCM10017750_07870 [Streptomyces racemochromogenes]
MAHCESARAEADDDGPVPRLRSQRPRPHVGTLKLDQLAHRHISAYVEHVLYVRCTLSAIDNNHLVITTPKTPSSRGRVAISPRVPLTVVSKTLPHPAGSLRSRRPHADQSREDQHAYRPPGMAATTSIPGTEKAALSRVRERPPTCINAGRDDRI